MPKQRTIIILIVALTGILTIICTEAQTQPSQPYTVLCTIGDPTVANVGKFPVGPLIQGPNGNLYGTTLRGGSADRGTVFQLTPAGVLTTLHSFGDGSVINDGLTPQGIILGSDGNFYGVTCYGGSSLSIYGGSSATRSYLGGGTIFKMDMLGRETILHNFEDGTVPNDGRVPGSPLIEGVDGNFYGTTLGAVSGTDSQGAIFKCTPTGKITILHVFDGISSNTEGGPSQLTQGPDGNFYGVCSLTGSAANGALFKVTSSGTYSVLHRYDAVNNNQDGSYPQGSFTLGLDGTLYSTTFFGGSTASSSQKGYGTFFSMSPTGVTKILHNFQDGTVVNDGAHPTGGLVLSSNGNLYGVGYYANTLSNGTSVSGYGALFEISPSGRETIIHNFTDSFPTVRLIGRDGNIYGSLEDAHSQAVILYRITASQNISKAQASTSSTFQIGNPASSGNDSDNSSRWAAVGPMYPQFWQVDLGSNRTITRVDINWYNSAVRSYRYIITVSSDNVNFRMVKDGTNNATVGVTSDIVNSTSARYVRVIVTGCSDPAGWPSAYDISVLGY